MTPGTRPSRRTARAAPLPARGRTVALISLAVAMCQSSFNRNGGVIRLSGERSDAVRCKRRRGRLRRKPAVAAANLQGGFGAADGGLIPSVAPHGKKRKRGRNGRGHAASGHVRARDGEYPKATS